VRGSKGVEILVTIHAGHIDVHENDLKGLSVLLKFVHGVLAIIRTHTFVLALQEGGNTR
jgi:hypothetical protein